MKKTKKPNIKLNRKKYTIAEIGRVIARRFYYLAFCMIIGINVGLVFYFVIPSKTYSSRCNIQYNGSALADTQKSRVVGSITCNEFVDKYVASLSKAGIRKDGTPYTFNDISSGLTASVATFSSDSKSVIFTVSFVQSYQGNTHKVLKVIAEQATKSLKEIYTKDDFSVVYGSLTNEFSINKRNLNYLLTPVAASILAGVVLMFIFEGIDDIMHDIGDCVEFNNKRYRFNKKNGDVAALTSILTSEKQIIVCNQNDSKAIFEYFEKASVIKKNHSLVHSSPKQVLSIEEYVKDNPLKTKESILFVVLCEKTSYSDFCDNIEMISKKTPIEKLNILCIEPWKEKKKHAK